MKKKINLSLVPIMLFSFAICFAQDDRTPEKKKADSLEFAKFKKYYPEEFNNKLLTTKFKDGSYIIKGYSTIIQINNNHIKDSTAHNFTPDMPDTSTVNPYNDIKVTDKKITIRFLHHIFLGSGIPGNGFIADLLGIKSDKIDAKPFWLARGNDMSVKMSINGKLIFDWRALADFKQQVYDIKYNFFIPGKTDSVAFTSFNQAWPICDTSININDQLLIEVKNNKNNSIVDRYNITRVVLLPTVSAINFAGKNTVRLIKEYKASLTDNKIIIEKKGFSFATDIEKVNLQFTAAPLIDNSNLEYVLKSVNDKDSVWQAFPKEVSALPLNLQTNTDYDLLLRYSFLPDNISHYTISAKPIWWQTKAFRFWSGFVVGFLIIIIPFLIFINFRKRKLIKKDYEQKQKKLELKSIYAQLNPHFIFNALSSIQSLVNQNKNDDANYYITEFSSLLRQSLNNNEKEMVPLNVEIDTLQYYINLEKLRFNFDYTIYVDEKLDANSIDIPSLLLQPLIENGIKHGITPLKDKGLIAISFISEQKDLLVTIKDNGVGFDTTKTYTGYGLRLTSERIELLNQTLKKQSIVFLIDSNATGTTLHLRFKNWL